MSLDVCFLFVILKMNWRGGGVAPFGGKHESAYPPHHTHTHRKEFYFPERIRLHRLESKANVQKLLKS